MKNAKLLVVGVLLIGLVGCKDDEPAAQVQTVDWYKAHQAERAAVLTKCNNNPGQLGATPNCVNASRAESSATWSKRGGIKLPVALTAEQMKKP
jgi:predicted homoserine dehydrogenase-like protein